MEAPRLIRTPSRALKNRYSTRQTAERGGKKKRGRAKYRVETPPVSARSLRKSVLFGPTNLQKSPSMTKKTFSVLWGG